MKWKWRGRRRKRREGEEEEEWGGGSTYPELYTAVAVLVLFLWAKSPLWLPKLIKTTDDGMQIFDCESHLVSHDVT